MEQADAGEKDVIIKSGYETIEYKAYTPDELEIILRVELEN